MSDSLFFPVQRIFVFSWKFWLQTSRNSDVSISTTVTIFSNFELERQYCFCCSSLKKARIRSRFVLCSEKNLANSNRLRHFPLNTALDLGPAYSPAPPDQN